MKPLDTVNFLSVIVCTHNRVDILQECLKSLTAQSISKEFYEVIVVDNASTDSTKELVNQFSKEYNNVNYILEEKVGLSHARNCGYKNAASPWVAYMDDDGIPKPNYVEKSLEVINNYPFDCLGGRYTAWYQHPKPKWLPEDFGCSTVFSDKTAILEKEFNSGGIIFFKKEVLEEIGGFSTSLGMSGNKIAYGEETEIQKKLRDKGYTIGYSPEIMMKHLVNPKKLKLSWHLKNYYSHGRDNTHIYKSANEKITKFSFLKLSLLKLQKNTPRAIKKLVFTKEYYIQNFLLDTLQPLFYLSGQYSALKKIHQKK